ncbi:YfhO family protein [Furfurilactobacillus sp. WILCCON 0119]
MIKQHFTKHWPLYLSFFIPALLMTSYFACRGMAPFGSSSLLTVDMGQQYIDFYAFFRNTLLHHPGSFFYSFSKALGGETSSLWAYYLMSPFNFLILPFSRGGLSAGVFLITVMKYGSAGLSMAWVLQRLRLQRGWRLPMFAIAYALCGWTVANQLNLMWLDALVTLPLVVYGLERLLTAHHWLPYVCWLGVTFIVNYYMAYMVALFTILYVLFSLVWHRFTWRTSLLNLCRYAGASVIGGGLAAIILIPTYFALQLSKASYTVVKVKWAFDYMPAKMLGKLFPGGFNFAQMPKGQPNIFVGAVVLLLVVAFFIETPLRWSVKLTAGLITVFLLLSMCFTPLNLLWHAGQFPIWYPYRFSFVFCFWLIWLAAIAWPTPQPLRWETIGTAAGLLAVIVGYLLISLHSVNFLTVGQIITGSSFMLIALLLLAPWPGDHTWMLPILVLLTAADLGTNVVLSLNKISYVPQDQFSTYTDAIDSASTTVKSLDDDLYRIGTTFQRTKDDPMQGDYFGGSHFGSTLERKTTGFYDLTGNPDGDGFVTYANGTKFMDALLNMKYFWTANETTAQNHKSVAYKNMPTLTYKPDITSSYDLVHSSTDIRTYKNPDALGMGFMAAASTLSVKNIYRDPMTNQNQLWNAFLGEPSTNKLFTAVNFDSLNVTNTNKITNITGATLNKTNLKKPASMTLHFTPTTDDAYYLSIGSNLQKDNVTILLNGQPLSQYDTYRNTVLVNLASGQKDQPQTITFELKKPTLWLQNVTLYHLPSAQYKHGIKRLQQHPLLVTSWGQTHINGTVTATKDQPVLMTSIPAQAGWHVKVDGHTVTPTTIADEFMALRLSPGHHDVSFTYRPPYFLTGLIATIIAACLTAGTEWVYRRKHLG